MATKNNPGSYDCYAEAAPDEPIFTLRANDEIAPNLVMMWALIRSRAPIEEINEQLFEAIRVADSKPAMKHEKYIEACECASDMVDWHGE
jgi:hypothetical protein